MFSECSAALIGSIIALAVSSGSTIRECDMTEAPKNRLAFTNGALRSNLRLGLGLLILDAMQFGIDAATCEQFVG